MKIPNERINVKKLKLQSHPLLTMNTIQTMDDLRLFMEHHVFAVWDFMCLAKSLQDHVCPSGDVWMPVDGTRNGNARLINEIILCEESDRDMGGGSISHFDLYLQAMHEIGADTSHIDYFLDHASTYGVKSALGLNGYYNTCMEFVNSTFDFIYTDEAHVIAAAFTYGRETVIPGMFKSILNQLNISRDDAPKFYYYLERHIEVDGDEHGPAAEKLVESICGTDPLKYIEAERAALKAIDARIKFWDGVEEAILKNDSLNYAAPV
jgi:hypothetical protein